MPRKNYSLWVYYPAEHRSIELDDQISQTVGCDPSGGGTDFTERDMDFSLDSKEESKRAIVALSHILPTGSSVMLSHFQDLKLHASIEIIEKQDIQVVAAMIEADELHAQTPKAKAPHKRTGL